MDKHRIRGERRGNLYPDPMRDKIVDGESGADITEHTGSTSGTTPTIKAGLHTPEHLVNRPEVPHDFGFESRQDVRYMKSQRTM